jgi:hypothetical protein
MMEGPIWRWTAREWSVPLILGVIMGLILGNVLYKKPDPVVPAPGPSSLRTVRPTNQDREV